MYRVIFKKISIFRCVVVFHPFIHHKPHFRQQISDLLKNSDLGEQFSETQQQGKLFVVCNITVHQSFSFFRCQCTLSSVTPPLVALGCCGQPVVVFLYLFSACIPPSVCGKTEKNPFLKKSLSMCAPSLSSNLFHLSLETGFYSGHLTYWDIQLR